jgi:hypothetical protein
MEFRRSQIFSRHPSRLAPAREPAFATGDHAAQPSFAAQQGLLDHGDGELQKIESQDDSMLARVTKLVERINERAIMIVQSAKEVLRFYYVRKNELRSSP